MRVVFTVFLSLIIFTGFGQLQSSYVVSTIAAMKTYYGSANKIYVAQKNEEYMICSPCTADEISIYAGAGGRKWMKYSDTAKLNKADSSVGYTTNYKNSFNARDTEFIINTNYLNDFQTNGTGANGNINITSATYDGTNKREVITSSGAQVMYFPGVSLTTGHRYTAQINLTMSTTTSVQVYNKYSVGYLGTIEHSGTYYYTFVADVTDALGIRSLILVSGGAGVYYINYCRVQEVPLNYEYATKGDIKTIIPGVVTDSRLLLGIGASDSASSSTVFATQRSTVVGINASSTRVNSVVLGESAKAYSSPYNSSGSNGECLAAGFNAWAGDWRAVAVGGRAQALAVSTTVVGYGAYCNIPHGSVTGRGGYNSVGGNLIYTGGGGGDVFIGGVGSAWLNPAMPGGESVDNSAAQNAGTVYSRIYGIPGTDLKATPTLTNVRGGHLRLVGGKSTGTAQGGNVELAITLPGGSSNNINNTEFVGLTVSGATGNTTMAGTATATQFRLSASNTAPSSATDTGTLGEIRITSGFVYYCYATNTWVRAALATW